jgi:hypothetical protein
MTPPPDAAQWPFGAAAVRTEWFIDSSFAFVRSGHAMPHGRQFGTAVVSMVFFVILRRRRFGGLPDLHFTADSDTEGSGGRRYL